MRANGFSTGALNGDGWGASVLRDCGNRVGVVSRLQALWGDYSPVLMEERRSCVWWLKGMCIAAGRIPNELWSGQRKRGQRLFVIGGQWDARGAKVGRGCKLKAWCTARAVDVIGASRRSLCRIWMTGDADKATVNRQ